MRVLKSVAHHAKILSSMPSKRINVEALTAVEIFLSGLGKSKAPFLLVAFEYAFC